MFYTITNGQAVEATAASAPPPAGLAEAAS
jgi:hypothetical protein